MVVAAVVVLGGCSAVTVPEAAAPSEAPEPSAAATTPATDPASPAPDAIPADFTCESVLTPTALADIDSAGYLLRTEVPSGPDSIMSSMLDQGGVNCYWVSAGDDVVAWLGQAPMDEARWHAQRAELVAAGYTESDDPMTGTLRGPRSGDDYPTVVNSGGVTYYVGQPGFLSSVLSLQ